MNERKSRIRIRRRAPGIARPRRVRVLPTTGGRGRAAVAALGAGACLALAGGAFAQAGAASGREDALSLARETLKEHFKTQELISREEAEWKLGKEILLSRIEFLQAQVEELKKRTSEAEASITEADKERGDLISTNEDLDKVEEIQLAAVEECEERVRRLVPKLPGVLKDKIQPPIERLPEAGMKREDIELSVSQRFANALLILKEVNRFARDITVVAERRKMDDGREAEVSTMYIGIAQAYYAGSGDTANVAGIGVPGDDGWTWEPRPDEADAIRRLMAIHSLEEDAAFLAEPVIIK